MQTKVTPSGGGTPTVTNYLVDTTGSLSQVVAETAGTGAVTSLYVRADNELLAVLRPASASTWTTRYVHVDGLGSVRVLTDETGVVADTRGYEAFGTRNVTVGSDPLAFGFAGEPFEAKSQLAYHRARWMDPGRGRFVSTDPSLGFVLEPASLHRYLYASANPVRFVDPTGQEYDMPSVSAVTTISGVLATQAQPAMDAVERLVPALEAEGEAIVQQAEVMAETVMGEAQVLAPGTSSLTNLWGLNPFARGNIIEQILGKNVPGNFPTIDRLLNGVATSIKSLNTTAQSYQDIGSLTSRVTSYITKIANFNGMVWNGQTVKPSDFPGGLELLLAIPRATTPLQLQAIQSLQSVAQSVNVRLTVVLM